MTTATRGESRISDLDPGLLRTPFETETNWHVITGAPSCGKTTLIELLANQGLATVPEAAREFIEHEMSKGRSIDEIHQHGAELQQRILDVKLRVERALPPNRVLFLDDAIPGSISWYRLFGLNPNSVLPHCFHHRYASVFVLDPLPIERDGLRFEDNFTGVLDEWIESDYRALGYSIVRVPALTPPEIRLEEVLQRIGQHTT